jgi:hypothetical protein
MATTGRRGPGGLAASGQGASRRSRRSIPAIPSIHRDDPVSSGSIRRRVGTVRFRKSTGDFIFFAQDESLAPVNTLRVMSFAASVLRRPHALGSDETSIYIKEKSSWQR